MAKAKNKIDRRIDARIKGWEDAMKIPGVNESNYHKPGSRKKVANLLGWQ